MSHSLINKSYLIASHPSPASRAPHQRHFFFFQNKCIFTKWHLLISFSCAHREGTVDVSVTMATCPGPVTKSGSCGPLSDSEAAAGSGGLCLVHLLSVQSDEPWVDPERTTHTDTQSAVFLFLRYLSVRHLPPAQWDV